MRFDSLIDKLPITPRRGSHSVDLAGLTDDSREVAPGDLFIARPGSDQNPMRFVPAAVDRGAAGLLLPDTHDAAIDSLLLPQHVAVATAKPDTPVDQRLAGRLAERFYDHPSTRLKLLGVTGTNGKTTTVTLAKHLLESAGHKTGLIGTVELDTGSPDGPTPAQLTTPGAIQLTKLLAEMVANGCTHCVMEVSSHALHQGRADHVRFAAAAFTNLTQDHLDYHGSMPAYADAKAILFENLDQDAFAVLNGDDPWAARMARGCKAQIAFSVVLE
ncbi:MAG: Mur ligase family protein, partial [Phycisphaeraceae bacterium]